MRRCERCRSTVRADFGDELLFILFTSFDTLTDYTLTRADMTFTKEQHSHSH